MSHTPIKRFGRTGIFTKSQSLKKACAASRPFLPLRVADWGESPKRIRERMAQFVLCQARIEGIESWANKSRQQRSQKDFIAAISSLRVCVRACKSDWWQKKRSGSKKLNGCPSVRAIMRVLDRFRPKITSLSASWTNSIRYIFFFCSLWDFAISRTKTIVPR